MLRYAPFRALPYNYIISKTSTQVKRYMILFDSIKFKEGGYYYEGDYTYEKQLQISRC